jgi:hypothetical protein
MSETLHRVELENSVRLYIGFNGKYKDDETAPHNNVMYVERWKDGCFHIICTKKYFYAQEAEAIAKALAVLVDERKAANKKAQRDWYQQNKDLHEHDGAKVDLSIAEAREALSTCEIIREDYPSEFDRGVAQRDGTKPRSSVHWFIMYKGKKWALARTDLLDDICTTRIEAFPVAEHTKTLKMIRSEYRRGIQFGARLKEYKERGKKTRRCFAIVDSLSDG